MMKRRNIFIKFDTDETFDCELVMHKIYYNIEHRRQLAIHPNVINKYQYDKYFGKDTHTQIITTNHPSCVYITSPDKLLKCVVSIKTMTNEHIFENITEHDTNTYNMSENIYCVDTRMHDVNNNDTYTMNVFTQFESESSSQYTLFVKSIMSIAIQ